MPWKLPLRVAGRAELAHCVLYGVGGLSQRHALREVEADGDGRKLALMADRERPHRHRRPLGENRERDLFARERRLDVDLVQRVDLALQLGQDLEDHVIAVELREVLRDLPLAEGVVERVVDELRCDAVTGRRVAVDRERQRGAVGLLVGGDVAQLRQRRQLLQDFRRPGIQFVEIGVLKRIFELRAGRAAAEPDVLRRLKKLPRAFDLVEFRPQPRDHLLRRGIALLARLQRDVHAAVVERAAAAADEHGDAGDAGIGHHDPAELLLLLLHFGERDVLRGLGGAEDHAVVLLREEPLRDDDEQVDRQAERHEEHEKRGPPPAQHEIESAAIGVEHAHRNRAR